MSKVDQPQHLTKDPYESYSGGAAGPGSVLSLMQYILRPRNLVTDEVLNELEVPAELGEAGGVGGGVRLGGTGYEGSGV